MASNNKMCFGLIKTLVDVHTMGVKAAASLLSDCGYSVVISPLKIEDAMDKISSESNQHEITAWIKENGITSLSFSYRLDPDTAVELLGKLVLVLKQNGLYGSSDSQVRSISFAGLAPACKRIDREYDGRIVTFKGGESAEETLLAMGVPLSEIPQHIKEGCQYDKQLLKFGKQIINDGSYKDLKAPVRNSYPEFGTDHDSLVLRLDNNYKGGFQPVIRAHSGPYSNDMTREECLLKYLLWCKELGKSGYLDILSIGSSQLSQSNFGEKWDGKPNGGGVPVNSENEYHDIWMAAKPMLVRTYSGTKNVRLLADVYERSINIAWHALSLWWFNEIDGRGPNSLYENLREHIDTIKHIASTSGKPVETNVPHHFAFRGADDVTYIISGFLAAKMAKLCGVKVFILQNMLNTPRSTWGIQDLAKGRVLLKLVKELENESFRVLLQTRAGLDYFKPDLNTAKAQLASVTAMMDDIDPLNLHSPDIIHVVSYSEALFLATPEIIDDSIKITRASLSRYRELKKNGLTPDVLSDNITGRQYELEVACRKIIKAMEETIPDLYSPEGLYIAFIAGWLPVPDLWTDSEEFSHAKNWTTRMSNGGVALCDKNIIMPVDARINRCISNNPDAEYMLRSKYGIKNRI